MEKQIISLNDTGSYTFSFESSEQPEKIFETLIDVRKWWSGIYGEDIKGNSKLLNDEFTFRAGDGVHYTKQQVIEVEPNKKIVWLVTESNLSFVDKTDEWTGTKFGFEITNDGNKSIVTFIHQGLVPKFECYKDCSNGWSQYLEKLSTALK